MAATTSVLLPALGPLGFKKRSPRVIGRIRNGIFQFLDLQMSSFGEKNFCVNYASVSLSFPRAFLVLEPGGRLRNAGGTEAWWPASSHDMADNSMQEVVQAFQDQAIPFFTSTETVGGLLDVLLTQDRMPQHHVKFELGCCLAKLGRMEDAEGYLARAISLYRADGRTWCQEYITKCEELIGAIRRGVASDLLQEWTRQSMRVLRLEKLA